MILRSIFAMTLRLIKCFFFLIAIFFKSELIGQSLRIPLSKWEFKNTNETVWMGAEVPGCVHLDLLNNKKIVDPLYGSNEKEVQWIENESWEYRTYFRFDNSYDSVRLCFDGLDTYAEIFVNKKKVLKTENMFLHYEVMLKRSELRAEENELHVVFTPSLAHDAVQKKALKLELPGAYVYTRKAAYNYGWDWGPRLLTCGIWKHAFLQYDALPEVMGWSLNQKELTNEEATLNLQFQLRQQKHRIYQIKVEDRTHHQTLVSTDISASANTISGGKDIDNYTTIFKIKNPKLWWCHGYGEAFMYDFHITINADDGTVILDTSAQLGLRNIALIQEKESQGKSFMFRLNGVPIFCKGANLIPVQSYACNERDSQYRRLIDDAVAVNMNMLRVWGGGIYPDDYFYRYCNEKGILVWQDLMFSCSVYPTNKEFINSVKEEISQQVKRIGNNTCIALWCGNNEVTEGWNNWGWQKQLHYSSNDSSNLWRINKNLFETIIPNLIHSQFPNANYWASSPSIGWGHKEAMKTGDMHYWGVWWGMEPFESYIQHTGRFMSEYGFQSLPEMNSLRRFLPADSLTLASSAIKTHQKHPTGFETINTYMSRLADSPNKLEQYSYFSQYIQAEGMRIGIEAHRRQKPYCMGTLYWQLNDCWPSISWSSIDYYGHWKKLHYDLKHLYNTFLLSPLIQSDTIAVYVISDSIHEVNAILNLQYKNKDGLVLYSSYDTITVEPLSSNIKIFRSLKSMGATNEGYFTATLKSNQANLSQFLLPVEDKKFIHTLKPSKLTTRFISIGDQHFLKIKNEGSIVRDIFLAFDDTTIIPEENYFDLEGGEEKLVLLKGWNILHGIQFHFNTLNDDIVNYN